MSAYPENNLGYDEIHKAKFRSLDNTERGSSGGLSQSILQCKFLSSRYLSSRKDAVQQLRMLTGHMKAVARI